MCRVLVVDDERYSADYIGDLLRECKACDFDTYKAYSGIMALKVLGNTKIDILVVDIQMPRMNGIELARRTVAIWPRCRILFLTGYADFDYIYQCNTIPNARYLLKNESDDYILDAVIQAAKQIDTEMQMITAVHDAEESKILYNYAQQKAVLASLLTSDLPDGDPRRRSEMLKSIGLRSDEPMMMLYVGLENASDETRSADRLLEESMALFQCFRETLGIYCKHAMYDSSWGDFFWLVQPLNESCDTLVTYIRENMDDLIRMVKLKLNREMVVVLRKMPLKVDQVQEAYAQLKSFASDFLRKKTVTSLGVVFQEDDLPEEIEKNLSDRIKGYINQHLADDVTLSAVARNMNYNSSYISRVFKQQTGLKYSDYLTQKRLERAVALLENTNMTQQEIVSDVGYESVRYFNAVFKKKYGTTPGKYREDTRKQQ